MKTKQNILICTAFTAITLASCARKEPPVVVEQQPSQPVQAAPVVIAQTPAPEPVRESAWRPAPVRSNVPKPAQRPVVAEQPVAAAPAPAPVPVQQTAPTVVQQAPPPAPVAVAQAKAAPPQPMKVTLSEGSILAVRVGETLTSEQSHSGDGWSGTLAEPLVINGLVIAERGGRVEGRVTDVKRAGRVKGTASLTVELTRFVTADGQRIEIQTSGFSRAGKDETKRDVGKVAIASGIGAAIGAIAGGGKGAGIGAGAGAAAGTGAVLATRGGPAVIPTETLIRFRVAEPVTITEKLR